MLKLEIDCSAVQLAFDQVPSWDCTKTDVWWLSIRFVQTMAFREQPTVVTWYDGVTWYRAAFQLCCSTGNPRRADHSDCNWPAAVQRERKKENRSADCHLTITLNYQFKSLVIPLIFLSKTLKSEGTTRKGRIRTWLGKPWQTLANFGQKNNN